MQRKSKLYIVVAFHAMGPVTDARHKDLLNSWDEVDRAASAGFSDAWRMRLPDSRGRGIVLSHFNVSWSGFRSNPVQRPFGYHTVMDHYRERFGDAMDHYGDEVHWMYNHPAASGVGNEWGLDWLHNSHYLDILCHFVLDRAYFPAVIEVPTECDHTSHFAEQWFPIDFGNRNSPNIKLDSINADGKPTGAVLDWSISPIDWSHFHPHESDYRRPGGEMRRAVFRLVDIKSIVNVLSREDIEQAFRRAGAGHDTVICAYEHDFRDRYETIMELMIEPIHRAARDYPQVELVYAGARQAAKAVLGFNDDAPPTLELYRHREGLRIRSDKELFGPTPFVCCFDPAASRYIHLPVTKTGRRDWRLPDLPLPAHAVLGVAANDRAANTFVGRWVLNESSDEIVEQLSADVRVQPQLV